MEKLIQEGAEILVSGSAIFGQDNPRLAITEMKKIINRYNRQ
jgi:pentose-5-phosphate-3-epimerase